MGAIALRPNGGLTRQDPKRIKLFTQTVGKDLVGPEIDEAIEWCELYGANPFVKDIYFFVYGKVGQKGRKVVPVLSISMYRKIAARTKNYRPDEDPPRITYDEGKISAANPKGIVSCELSVFMHSHGQWHRITSRLRWEERAPIIQGFKLVDTGETWPDGNPKKDKVPDPTKPAMLDAGKQNWHTMPETMLAKCVEADAIRKAWPEETAGSYAEGELDRSDIITLTATEILEETEKDERLARVGGPAITIQWADHEALQRVPVGQAADRVLEFIAKNKEEPSAIAVWEDRNRYALQELWAMDKSAGLEVKKALEGARATLAVSE